MAHHHDHALGHAHGHGHIHTEDTTRLIWAFAVIFLFMLIEIAGGVLSGSLALLADATHMFADAVALGLAASAHMIARRPPDKNRHFGYQRVQVLAAFFNGATLIVLAIWIVAEAIQRFLDPRPVDSQLMLTVAIAGFAANAIAFVMLQSARTENVNIRGALLHVSADLASSVAAIVAAVLIRLTDASYFDPLLSVLVAAFICYSAIRLLIETGHILIEGAPKGIDVERLRAGVKESTGVEDVHHVRIWQITPDAASLTLHARIKDAAGAEKALESIKTYLEREYGIRQSTVQIEIGEGCPDGNCGHANGLDHDHVHEHVHGQVQEAEPARKTAAESHIHRHPKAALVNK